MKRVREPEPLPPPQSCPRCHRRDVSHRVVIGQYELRACEQCATGFKRTPGAVIEELQARRV